MAAAAAAAVRRFSLGRHGGPAVGGTSSRVRRQPRRNPVPPGALHASTASGEPTRRRKHETHFPTTPLQRLAVTGYAAVAALADPKRADMVAAVGDATGRAALERMYRTMLADPEGRAVLENRPVINEATVNLSELMALPEGTFGRSYADFMHGHSFSPDDRSEVRFVDDPDLAYVMLRYRQVHDFWHVLSGLPPTVEAEVALKWVELLQTGLPVCALSAVFGPLSLAAGPANVLAKRYLPWALRAGRTAKPLMCVSYERRWSASLADVRRELAFPPAPVMEPPPPPLPPPPPPPTG